MTMPSAPASPRTRRAQNHAEMRQAILEAARSVMRQDGVAALNLNKVAARVGMRTPSLYEYFDGKYAIYDALFGLGFTLFGERMAQVALGTGTWHENLQRAMEQYLQFALDYPELYQLCFERPVPGFEPSAESMKISLTLLHSVYERVAAQLGELGAAQGLAVPQLVDLAIALMHGLTAQHPANEPSLPLGQGRYGSLIPAAVTLFRNALDIPGTGESQNPKRTGRKK